MIIASTATTLATMVLLITLVLALSASHIRVKNKIYYLFNISINRYNNYDKSAEKHV